MQSTYSKAMSYLRISEGGYVNHPKDPGGATNFGITQAVYDAFRKNKARQSVKLITEAEVAAIYKTQYADKVRYDELPAGVDYATLDAAVNSGVSRGSKWLQSAVGAVVDGQIGPATVAKAKAAKDPIEIIKKLCATRTSFVRGLTIFKTFGKGWLSRIARVEAASVVMVHEDRKTSAPFISAHLSDLAADASDSAASSKQNATATSVTVATTGVGSNALTLDATTVGVVVAVVALLCVAFIYFRRKASIHQERATAYAYAALEFKD